MGYFHVPLLRIYYYISIRRDIFNPGPQTQAKNRDRPHVRTLRGDGGIHRTKDLFVEWWKWALEATLEQSRNYYDSTAPDCTPPPPADGRLRGRAPNKSKMHVDN